MLDQITNLVKSQAGEYLKTSGEDLNDEQINGVQDAAQESIVDGLKGELMSGNVSGISSLMSGGAAGLTGNPIVQKIIGLFSGSLVSKVGLGSGIANNLAGGMVPNILGSLGNKFQSTDEADKGFDLSALSGLAGGGGGLGGMVKGAMDNATDGAGGLGGMVKDAVSGGGGKLGDAIGGLGNMLKK